MPPGETMDTLRILSGGIPVAFLALIIIVVQYRDGKAKDAAYDAMLVAKDHEIAVLHDKLLAQANAYSDELMATSTQLQERMLTQWSENAPLFKQAVDVLKQALQALAVSEASAARRTGKG